jgi:biotin carboxyl carrier protein
MEFEFLVDGALRKISLEKKGKAYVIRDGETIFEAEIGPVSENELMILSGGRSSTVYLARDGKRKLVFTGGRKFVICEPRPEAGRFIGGEERTPEGGRQVKASMPGKVIKLNVAEGEEVRKNQTLVVIEAMKMEHEIKSVIEGLVKKIHVAAGDLVDSDKPLIELEPKECVRSGKGGNDDA